MSTNYKAPHYAVFSGLGLLLLPASQVQISFAVHFSKTLVTHILSLMWETKFHTHTKHQEKL